VSVGPACLLLGAQALLTGSLHSWKARQAVQNSGALAAHAGVLSTHHAWLVLHSLQGNAVHEKAFFGPVMLVVDLAALAYHREHHLCGVRAVIQFRQLCLGCCWGF
jgi:hypothetical protein